MEYFLEIFGDKTIGWSVSIISIVFFLWRIYERVEKYFSNKALEGKKREESLQFVINQVPRWNKEITENHKQLKEAIEKLDKAQVEQMKRIDEIEEANRKHKRNEIRERLLQSYRYYTNPNKNPAKAWTEAESEAFWGLFKNYEDNGGNGHIHSDVQPAMRELEVVPMEETERIAELMLSRK